MTRKSSVATTTQTSRAAGGSRSVKALARHRNGMLVEEADFFEDLVEYILKDPGGELRAYGPATEIVLFGSRACNHHRQDSDWDIMVFVDRDDDLLAWGIEEPFADAIIHVAHASARGNGMTHRVIREEQLALWSRANGLVRATATAAAAAGPDFVITNPSLEQATSLRDSTQWTLCGLLDGPRLLLWDNRHATFQSCKSACQIDRLAIPFTLHIHDDGLSINIHESLDRKRVGDPTLAAVIRSHPEVLRLGKLVNLNYDGIGKGDPDEWAASPTIRGPGL